MIRELLEKERRYLNHFFDHLDIKALEETVQILNDCKGMIILTGVGKSGFVAKKFSVTMTSTGSRAFFLSPTDALHGDFGMVKSHDVMLIFSKSGESDELLNLIPYLRNRGVKNIAVVANSTSRLAKSCDHVLAHPNVEELCPFNLAPTTSAVIQMIIGDVLAIALMRKKNFSVRDYAENHPAGRIGKRVTMKVKDLMLTGAKIPLCQPYDKLVDILVEQSGKQCGCVLVVDGDNKLKGIFTDGDLRRALASRGSQALDTPIEKFMIPTPRTIGQEDLAWKAMKTMESDQKHPITVLPVVEEDKVLGIIKMHDIVQSGI